jgi:S1-C subfamily serine protease
MNKPTASRSELWRQRLEHLRLWVRRAAPFAAGILTALAALVLYHALFPGPQPLTVAQVNTLAARQIASATPPPPFSERVYQAILPSLVLVQTKSTGTDGKEEDGLGTGVIIDSNGDILTALHVVAGASEVQLIFADGTQSAAQVGSKDPSTDIAVLQASQLPTQVVPATLGNPNGMQVGDEAYVVGNPFGLYDSMSAGVISGFNRSFQPTKDSPPLKGLIQIDTAVNPGNSGGPLLNRNGEVIGIVEGIVNPAGGNFFVGIGFAVPINVAGGAAGLPLD